MQVNVKYNMDEWELLKKLAHGRTLYKFVKESSLADHLLVDRVQRMLDLLERQAVGLGVVLEEKEEVVEEPIVEIKRKEPRHRRGKNVVVKAEAEVEVVAEVIADGYGFCKKCVGKRRIEGGICTACGGREFSIFY